MKILIDTNINMMEKDATNVQAVYRLANLAGKYVGHVYVGNC